MGGAEGRGDALVRKAGLFLKCDSQTPGDPENCQGCLQGQNYYTVLIFALMMEGNGGAQVPIKADTLNSDGPCILHCHSGPVPTIPGSHKDDLEEAVKLLIALNLEL